MRGNWLLLNKSWVLQDEEQSSDFWVVFQLSPLLGFSVEFLSNLQVADNSNSNELDSKVNGTHFPSVRFGRILTYLLVASPYIIHIVCINYAPFENCKQVCDFDLATLWHWCETATVLVRNLWPDLWPYIFLDLQFLKSVSKISGLFARFQKN